MKKKQNFLLYGAIAVAVVFAALFLLQGTPTPIDTGGTIDENGACMSREGTEFVVCCGVENKVTGKVDWVPCGDTIKADETQAIVSLNGATAPYYIDVLCYSVKVKNNGNVPLDLTFDSTTSTGGASAGNAEFQRWFTKFVGQKKLATAAGQEVYFSQDCMSDAIRLSTTVAPYGVNTIPDGSYVTNLIIKGVSPSGKVVTQPAQITQTVTQESVSFSVDIVKA